MADKKRKTQLSRRNFLRSSAAVGTGFVFSPMIVKSQTGCGKQDKAKSDNTFSSNWYLLPNRCWIGETCWANPWESWAIANGELVCLQAGRDYNVHNLICQMTEGKGSFKTEVSVRFSSTITNIKGSAGFRVAIKLNDPIDDYRSRLLRGGGINAGITTDGKLFIRGKQKQLKDEAVKEIQKGSVIKLSCEVFSGKDAKKDYIKLSALINNEFFEFIEENVQAEKLSGNVALYNNIPKWTFNKSGIVFFSNWKICGSKVQKNPNQAFGPILWSLYTLNCKTLKLMAQMPPLGKDDNKTVTLEFKGKNGWKHIRSINIDPASCTALFKIDNWDDSKDHDYRLRWHQNYKNGTSTDFYWHGKIRKDPVDKKEIIVGGFCCFADYVFPNANIVGNVKKQNPDLLVFMGDQIYEPNGGYGILRRGETSRLFTNYLRKYSLLMWSFRELTAERPTICMPDDHDVYQSNLWGLSGREITVEEWEGPSGLWNFKTYGCKGGYVQPPDWINAVERTQTGQLPDPYDPTPIDRGIGVYYTDMYYGGVSFAILEDRKFKTGPMTFKIRHNGPRPDHIKTEEDALATNLDIPEAKLYGPRQIKFVKDWIKNRHPEAMKIAFSQTIPCNAATHHGSYNDYIHSDLDSNGWPSAGRNLFLKTLEGKALVLAGDQHLPTIVQHGVDDWEDSGYSFCVPAGSVIYQRWWRPEEANRLRQGERINNAPNTGRYIDGFGNYITMLAVGNPGETYKTGTLLERETKKSSGWGIIRLNKQNNTITMEAWQIGCDVNNPDKNSQFPGWPMTVKMS